MTGGWVDDVMQTSFDQVLRKPFRLEQLSRALWPGSGLAHPARVTPVGHVVLEAWNPRAALATLARGVFGRATSRLDARRWFVLWPAIPEPALYAPVRSARSTTQACAA